GLLIAVF
ncbi:hypothetical protein VCPCS022_001268B, partial [Vibrio cholerae O1 str. PCS-022]